MAEDGYEDPAFDPDEWRGNDDDDDDGECKEATPFIPGSASTPGPSDVQIEMKTMHHEKSGPPEMSCVETSFGGRNITDENVVRRLRGLRRNTATDLLDTTSINPRENPLSDEDQQTEIRIVKTLIRNRYHTVNFDKMGPIRFSN